MQVKNNLIFDDEGRTLILRGANLGGDSKIPFCSPGEEVSPSFLDKKNKVSFVGRPFPLDEADIHFKRLKNAGFTFLRFLVTWEAIEHEGPGIYDEEYIDYLKNILIIAEKHGINVFIDPHQDVWSRWTGGDGAPAWTMEKLGMDTDMMDRTGAAVTRQRYGLYHRSNKHPDGDPFPKMRWPSNYDRYAAATMFTLFYAGIAYAPDLKIDGENVQDWLQNKYIAAFSHLQRRLKNITAVKGWGVMNEPHKGYIGQQNLKLVEDIMIPVGPRPTPWQTIRSASGYPVEVPVYSYYTAGRFIGGYETFNPAGVSLFKEGFTCPWKQAGVWQDEDGKPKLVKPDYFNRYKDKTPIFVDDFLKPFQIKFINTLKQTDEKTFFFIEGLPVSRKAESHPTWTANDPANVINAFHWYDGLTLFTKTFRSWFTIDYERIKFIPGAKKVGEFFTYCLAQGIEYTKQKMNNMPVLLGEFGLPFDMNKRKAFKTGNYKKHEKALSMYYDSVDATMMHSTIWNYTATNTNKYGDGWNDEDLSVFSEGKERAVAGWKRPYPMATAGRLTGFNWNTKKKEFAMNFTADKNITAPTLIYLPAEPASVETNLRWEYNNEENKLLVYNDDYSGEAVIKVRLK